MLATHALSKIYANNVAVNKLELEVKAGKVLGFLGPNEACICRQICEERKPSQRIT